MSLPRETLKWILGLDLSYPVKNVRRDFANGFLVAELLSRYYPADVQMHSFENVASMTRKKQNWHLLEKLFKKKQIPVEHSQVEAVMAAETDAAVDLVQLLYEFIHSSAFGQGSLQDQSNGPPHASVLPWQGSPAAPATTYASQQQPQPQPITYPGQQPTSSSMQQAAPYHQWPQPLQQQQAPPAFIPAQPQAMQQYAASLQQPYTAAYGQGVYAAQPPTQGPPWPMQHPHAPGYLPGWQYNGAPTDVHAAGYAPGAPVGRDASPGRAVGNKASCNGRAAKAPAKAAAAKGGSTAAARPPPPAAAPQQTHGYHIPSEYAQHELPDVNNPYQSGGYGASALQYAPQFFQGSPGIQGPPQHVQGWPHAVQGSAQPHPGVYSGFSAEVSQTSYGQAPLSGGREDADIPFSKRRPVEYQPYDIKDFEDKTYNVKRQGGNYWQLGRLGPDLETEELQAKREKAERVKALAAEVRAANLKKSAASAGRPKSEAIKEPSLRDKAMQFAKNIPKPDTTPAGAERVAATGNNKISSSAGPGAPTRTAATSSSSAAKKGTPTPERLRATGAGAAAGRPAAGALGTPPSMLQLLEKQHAEDSAKVEAIRAQLQRLL